MSLQPTSPQNENVQPSHFIGCKIITAKRVNISQMLSIGMTKKKPHALNTRKDESGMGTKLSLGRLFTKGMLIEQVLCHSIARSTHFAQVCHVVTQLLN